RPQGTVGRRQRAVRAGQPGRRRGGPAVSERISRRRLLAVGGAGATGALAAGGAGLALAHSARDARPEAAAAGAVPFHGEHQAGIVTPAQDRLHFVAFDVITDKRAELVDLLRAWTAAAARVTAGHDAGTVGAVSGAAEAPPDDTGEALGLPPSGLTLTVGF